MDSCSFCLLVLRFLCPGRPYARTAFNALYFNCTMQALMLLTRFVLTMVVGVMVFNATFKTISAML